LILLTGPAWSDSEVWYGNWKITELDVNSSVILRGIGKQIDPVKRDTEGTYFTLQCFPNSGVLTIALPLPDPLDSTIKTVEVNAWNEIDSTDGMRFLNFQNLSLAQMSSMGKNQSDDINKFVNMLSSSKKFFAYGFNSFSFRFDSRDLHAAYRKFSSICLPAN
jgi:hypothetical protein